LGLLLVILSGYLFVFLKEH